MTRITDMSVTSKLTALCGSSSRHLQGAGAYCARAYTACCFCEQQLQLHCRVLCIKFCANNFGTILCYGVVLPHCQRKEHCTYRTAAKKRIVIKLSSYPLNGEKLLLLSTYLLTYLLTYYYYYHYYHYYYTIPVSQKTGHQTLAHNFAKCWSILKIFHILTQK